LATFTYKDVRMVLAESDSVFSGNIIDAMSTRGVRDPAICRSAEALRTAIANAPIDLIMCDVDLPGLDFGVMAQDIRHGRLGKNPFAILIATARPSTGTDLGRVMKSGIDYIVLKPMTADQVVRRLDGFTRGRKPFVVTESFIGPNRRALRRNDGSDDDLTAVPNTLRVKVVFNHRLSLLGQLMNVGTSRLTKKKSETRLRTVTRLSRRLIDLHKQASLAGPAVASGEWRKTLALLVEKTDEITSEHKGDSATDHIAEIGARIGQLARRWTDATERPPVVEVVLVAQLADALSGAYAQNEDVPDIAREIAAVVDSFLAKGEGEAEQEGA
jgi:DNA-binding response OmpR family regulator